MAIACAGSGVLLQCADLRGLSGGGPGDAGDDRAGSDAPLAQVDAPTDGHREAQGDASDDSDAAVPTVYRDITVASNWATFDVSSLGVTPEAYFGAVFDGHYLFFVPNGMSAAGGIFLRYDTTASFGADSSWTAFDLSQVNPSARGYIGGTFDGRHVYYAPFSNGTSDGIAARYDTTGAFGGDAGESWATFDTTTVAAQAAGFSGAAFDGRYVYFAPYSYGTVTRFDTTLSFESAAAWATFDAGTISAGSTGSQGEVFDGRYLYLVPFNGPSGRNGVVTRYDTTASFVDAISWTSFDTSTLPGSPKGFIGGAFDGRFVYLAPNSDGTPYGLTLRYDTTAPFATAGSWHGFDVSELNAAAKGFAGAGFDGRYLFLVPYNNGAPDGLVARLDTTGGFGDSSSWSFFDVSTVSSDAKGFLGAAFDGQYIYLVPRDGTTVARFDAKTPPSIPSTVHGGSFF